MRNCAVQTVIEAINKLAPSYLAEEWDNIGLLVGEPRRKVKKILICLDVSEQVISKAIELNVKLIVSHHPLIFHPIKNLRLDLILARKIESLIKNDIAVFTAHTNLDRASNGVNEKLAEKLELLDVKNFENEELSLGRIGKLKFPMTILEFANHTKKVLKAENVRVVSAGDFLVERVGVCSGAGSEFIHRMKFYGVQAFVTGDVKYHEAQSAIENKIHLIDAGHFYTEFPIVQALSTYLKHELKNYDVEIFEDHAAKDLFSVI